LAISIVFGLSINYGDSMAIIMLSFLFALLPMVAIVFFAPKTRSSPSTLILAGVALSYLFNSLNTFILVAVDSETLSTIYVWQTGTLGSASWEVLPAVLLFITAGSIVVMYLSKQLNLLALGDASATSLGVDPDNLRIICLVAIAFIVGAVVGCAGVIGFVGLVTPHIVRMLIGSDNRFVIPAASCLAMLLMLLADMGCRAISEYDNIPIGAALSLIGAPIFLYLIISKNSYVW
jgi:iron complex transport system permease protein